MQYLITIRFIIFIILTEKLIETGKLTSIC